MKNSMQSMKERSLPPIFNKIATDEITLGESQSFSEKNFYWALPNKKETVK